MFAFFGSPGVVELLILGGILLVGGGLTVGTIAVIFIALAANSKRRDD